MIMNNLLVNTCISVIAWYLKLNGIFSMLPLYSFYMDLINFVLISVSEEINFPYWSIFTAQQLPVMLR